MLGLEFVLLQGSVWLHLYPGLYPTPTPTPNHQVQEEDERSWSMGHAALALDGKRQLDQVQPYPSLSLSSSLFL